MLPPQLPPSPARTVLTCQELPRTKDEDSISALPCGSGLFTSRTRTCAPTFPARLFACPAGQEQWHAPCGLSRLQPSIWTYSGRECRCPLLQNRDTCCGRQQSGACTDLRLWPSAIKKVDFVGQVATFLKQSNSLDPESTLYAIFFGINDYENSKTDGEAKLQAAAQIILSQIRILASAPTNGRSFLVADVYGRGTHTPAGDAFVQTIFSGLHDLHRGVNSTGQGENEGEGPALHVAFVEFVEFARVWDGVLGEDPGYAAIGYVSTDACIVDCAQAPCQTDGMSDDPEHYFEYIPGHPSKEGMRIMADYVEEVLERCVVE